MAIQWESHKFFLEDAARDLRKAELKRNELADDLRCIRIKYDIEQARMAATSLTENLFDGNTRAARNDKERDLAVVLGGVDDQAYILARNAVLSTERQLADAQTEVQFRANLFKTYIELIRLSTVQEEVVNGR